MSKLPKGWVRTSLSEVSYIEMGQSPPSSSYNTDGKGIPFFQGKAEFGDLYPIAVKYCTEPKKIAYENDVLLSIRAPVGPTNLCNAEISIGRGLAAIRAIVIEFKFLFYYFRNAQPFLSKQGTGSTFKAINKKFIEEMDFKLPPLNEQKRIVDNLDKILEEVNNAKARLDQITIILKNFRRSSLRYALSGALTKNWRENRSFLDGNEYLEDIGKSGKENFKKPPLTKREYLADLPDSWTYHRLDYIAEVIDPNPRHRNPKYFDQGFFFLSTAQFSGHDGWDYSSVKYVSEETVLEQEKRCAFTRRSIVFSRKGTIGKTRFLPSDTRFALLDSVVVINPSELVDAKFVNYCLRADVVQKQVRSLTRGVALKQVSVGAVRSLVIPLPPIEEQREIVKKLDDLIILSNQVEEKYRLAMENVNKITQSILAKAFRGELVPQDPNDEHASIFLEKINAEKKLQELIPKQRNRKMFQKSLEVNKMILSVVDTLKKEKKPLTAQKLLEKSGYPVDSDPEKIEEFFLDIKASMREGVIIRERVKDEDIFSLTG